jgi:hypothetical protein
MEELFYLATGALALIVILIIGLAGAAVLFPIDPNDDTEYL